MKREHVKKGGLSWSEDTSDKMIAITTDLDEPIIVLGFQRYCGVPLPRIKKLHRKPCQKKNPQIDRIRREGLELRQYQLKRPTREAQNQTKKDIKEYSYSEVILGNNSRILSYSKTFLA